jgi:hypothetical protein
VGAITTSYHRSMKHPTTAYRLRVWSSKNGGTANLCYALMAHHEEYVAIKNGAHMYSDHEYCFGGFARSSNIASICKTHARQAYRH